MHLISFRNLILESVFQFIKKYRPNGDEEIDEDFKNARFAGEKGAECEKVYRCPHGDGFLDKFSYLI